MKAWATAKSIKSDVADVTDKYLDLFGANMPQHVRKYGDGETGMVVYNTRALIDCIERQVRFKTAGDPYGPHVPTGSSPAEEVKA